MSDISVSVASTRVTLADGRGALAVSVTNRGTSTARVVLGCGPASDPALDAGAAGDSRTWATVARPLREISPGATEDYVLEFNAVDLPAGLHAVKVFAYPADEAPEEYSDLGQVVRVEVPASRPPSVSSSRWWLWLLGAGGLVALFAVILLLTRSGSGEPGVSACTAADVEVAVGVTDGAAGSLYVPLLVSNVGCEPCSLAGVPAVAAVDAGGQEVALAAPAAIGTPVDIELGVGEVASALVRATAVPSGSTGCPPDTVALAVTLPGDAQAIAVAITLPACPGLSVRAFVPGDTGV